MSRTFRKLLMALAALLLAACALVAARNRQRATPAPEEQQASIPLAVSPNETPSASTASASSACFADVAEEAGLTVPHYSAADGLFRLVETMGSGVGFIDYDGDGWLDVFLAQGCPIPYEPAQRQYTAKLYRNEHNGRFRDVTEAAGVGFNGYGQGVAVGDYDGDGHDDLYVSAFGQGALYHNNGDGTFANVTEKAGVAGSGWATSCAWADLDGDGDLDLYVVHYLANTVDEAGRPTVNCNATPGHVGYCPPNAFAAEPDVLYRNNGDGTFTNMSDTSGIASAAGNGLGLAIADFDDDGRLDIFVANDQSPNFLWHNLGGMKFEDVALPWGLAYNEAGALRAGMGVAAGDYDGDGRLDLLVTNFYEEASTLYRNVRPGFFQVTTAQARLAVPSRSKLGFGTGWLDYDNDGRLDLFVANGHINDVRPLRMPYQMTPQLFHNEGGGHFVDASDAAGPYFRSAWLGRGAAFGDLDNDGATDIVVTHIGRHPALLSNQTQPRGHFLGLMLQGKPPHRSAVGARIQATIGERTLTRFVVAGTSYLSASDERVLLGLGAAKTVGRLTVRWASGAEQTFKNLPADQYLILAEGADPRPALGR